MIIIIKKDGQIVTDDGNPIEGKALEGAYMLLADAQDGDSIVYDGTNHMWKAGSSFDPTITDPQNGDTLVYNATQSKWVNGAGGDSFEPDISNPQDGDTLIYDGTAGKWKNGAASGGEPFVPVFTITESDGSYTVTCDKTGDEIAAAVSAGRCYYAKYGFDSSNIYRAYLVRDIIEDDGYGMTFQHVYVTNNNSYMEEINVWKAENEITMEYEEKHPGV